MADIMIRKRKRMRSKEIKALSKELEEAMGVPVFSEDDPVDMAESSDYNVIYVGQDILGIVYDGKATLTVRGVLKYKPVRKYVTVDMGAVPFVTNGADVMGPGITDAASIKYRNENDILATQPEPERYYIEVIMQDKLRINLDYVANHTIRGDLRLILNTFLAIIIK